MNLRHPKPSRRADVLILLAALVGLGFGFDHAVWDFQAGKPGQIAQGFTNEVGRWEVTKDGDNQVLAQRAENRLAVFNVALIDHTSYKNLDLSVRIKAVAGENERGGGLVWRAKDKDSYYVARYNPHVAHHNPREPNFRLYKVENGKRTQLDHAEAPGEGLDEGPDEAPREPRPWHTLRITMRGQQIVGYLDGKKLLEAEDATFVDVGKIGLWSHSDAQTYFDDLTVSRIKAESRE